MAEVTIRIEDMSCGGCVRNVTSVLKALAGVSEVSVSLEAAQAVVGYDPSLVTIEVMRAAIEDAGFGCPA